MTSPCGPTSTAPPSLPPRPLRYRLPEPPTRTARTATCSPGPRQNNIHLINVHEIFHRDRPMTLHRQYTAEHAKQLPRGYAGASDHLRLDIIHLLGGTYLDGDNHITTTTATGHGTSSLTAATRRRSSLTPRLHPPHAPGRHQQRPHHRPRPPPRHHPLARTRTRQLPIYSAGNIRRTGQDGQAVHRSIGRSDVPSLHRSDAGGAADGIAFRRSGDRLVRRADGAGRARHHPRQRTVLVQTRTHRHPPHPSPLPRSPTRLTRATTTLARQLTTREGNLHLTAIDPLITTLPDPDAAWTAIITLLAELTTPRAPPSSPPPPPSPNSAGTTTAPPTTSPSPPKPKPTSPEPPTPTPPGCSTRP